VLLVAGPDIRHADEEVRTLAELYPGARVLSGADATVGAVAAAMATATVVHIAAHGVFRSDNPLFSTLQLHDGPLSVHELEGLPRVPETVVLSACSSGRSGVLPGDELLGTSAALMSLGVRALAAPLVPIADRAAVPVALALHRGLRRGRPLADSLARYALVAEREGRTDVVAAASSFTCFGSKGR
jgi:CHAT domain-containing protein